MINRIYPHCLIVAVICIMSGGRTDADLRVWTEASGRRVLRDEPGGTGASVEISAARNEWESFQVLMWSDAPVKGTVLQAGDLKGPKGTILHGEDARLYRQHQLELTAGTHRNDGFKAGKIWKQQRHGRWVYWAVQGMRFVPLPGGPRAMYFITERYKAEVPEGG